MKLTIAALIGAGAGAYLQNCAWQYDQLGLWVFWLPLLCALAVLALALLAWRKTGRAERLTFEWRPDNLKGGRK